MILYLKSSISISSYNGCCIGCKYCILSTLKDRSCIKKIYDEEELIDNLLNYKYYTKTVPITINNITEPFMNKKITESTFKILEILNKRHLRNPIIIITKGYLNLEQAKLLENFSRLNILVFYTLSGLSETLENRNLTLQLETIQNLSKVRNIKLVHYWRPIIEGVNSDEKTIMEIAEIVVKYFKCSIVSGIRVNTFLKNVLTENKIPLLIQTDSEHKILMQSTYERVQKIVKQLNSNYPLFKKTSCAISWLFDRLEYNGYSKNASVCNEECPNYKRCKRLNNNNKCIKKFKKAFKQLTFNYPFELKEDKVYVNGSLSQEELSFLRHNSGIKVICKEVIKSNNEEILSE